MGPYDPGGGRTHNLKMAPFENTFSNRSLTRYPITPQGHLRTPGIEPELEPWKGAVLPLYYVCCPRGGSNTRSSAYKTNALPLSYWGFYYYSVIIL